MRKKATPAPLKLIVLGNAIERRRIAKRWSQAQLAKRSFLSPRLIARIERGHEALRILPVVKIAQALGTTAAYLMSEAKL